MSILNTLADWVVSRNKVWSEDALARAEHAIADTLACIIAGSADPVSTKVAAAVAADPDGCPRRAGCTPRPGRGRVKHTLEFAHGAGLCNNIAFGRYDWRP